MLTLPDFQRIYYPSVCCDFVPIPIDETQMYRLQDAAESADIVCILVILK